MPVRFGRSRTGSVFYKERRLSTKERIRFSYMVMHDVNHQLFTESGMDELLLSMERSGMDEAAKEAKAEEILWQLDFEKQKDVHPMSLSGGQKQRVSIACALASGKELLVYDEPTSGLDFRHMIELSKLIFEMKKTGRTQFILSHMIRSCWSIAAITFSFSRTSLRWIPAKKIKLVCGNKGRVRYTTKMQRTTAHECLLFFVFVFESGKGSFIASLITEMNNHRSIKAVALTITIGPICISMRKGCWQQ